VFRIFMGCLDRVYIKRYVSHLIYIQGALRGSSLSMPVVVVP
jgi:hypothetical protein